MLDKADEYDANMQRMCSAVHQNNNVSNNLATTVFDLVAAVRQLSRSTNNVVRSLADKEDLNVAVEDLPNESQFSQPLAASTSNE